MKISLSSSILSQVLSLLFLVIFTSSVLANDLNDGKKAYQLQDYQAALNAFTKAAENNNAEAQWRLGVMLFKGQGTTPDKVAAYSWLTLASEKNLTQAIDDKAKVKPFLSSVDIVLADTLTQGFKQTHNITSKAPKQIDAVVIEDKSTKFVSKESTEQEKANTLSKVEKEEVLIETPSSTKQKIPVEIQDKSTQLIIKNTDTQAIKASNNNEIKQAEKQAKEKSTISNAISTIEKKVAPQTTKETVVANYRVQVGAYSKKELAKQALAKITKKLPQTIAKYGSTITEPNTSSITASLHRLQLGSFTNRSDADALCKQLKQSKQPCFVIVQTKK